MKTKTQRTTQRTQRDELVGRQVWIESEFKVGTVKYVASGGTWVGVKLEGETGVWEWRREQLEVVE
jgi:hypothetical protein